ncbi:MAG: hypothetical protein WCJ30_03740, partial [Deltaproteobacteria bacterium]
PDSGPDVTMDAAPDAGPPPLLLSAASRGLFVQFPGHELQAVGSNATSRLGTAGSGTSPMLAPVADHRAVDQVDSTYFSSCSVAGGVLHCWGGNMHGEAGHGDMAPVPTPVAVAGLPGPVTHVSVGFDSTCAVVDGGSVYCWGAGTMGQLGNGASVDSLTPVRVMSITNAVEVTVSQSWACARLATGSVQCWGSGWLGDGATAGSSVPVPLRGITDARHVTIGPARGCVLRADATVWCWGGGSLGDGTTNPAMAPVRLPALSNVVDVQTRYFGSCALESDGTVWCWGNDTLGECGQGAASASPRLSPLQVAGLPVVAAMTVGSVHRCIRGVDGSVWCWGTNDDGELGTGMTGPAFVATPVRATLIVP